MPVVGLWGTFDLENMGDVMLARITRAELERRIPAVTIVTRSPIGYVGLNRFTEPDPGDVPELPACPLGSWSDERAAVLARGLDALVIGGGEILHNRDHELAPHYGLPADELVARAPHRWFVEGVGSALERDLPTAWHAVGVPFDLEGDLARRLSDAGARHSLVTVRDDGSAARLGAVAVDRVEVVPDPVFLASRHFDSGLVETRAWRLRASGRLPAGPFLVLQASRGLADRVDAIADAVAAICRTQGWTPVLAEIGPIHGDGEMADAFAERLPGAVRLGVAGTTDILAAIVGAEVFVGNSLHGNVLAATFDKPALLLNLASQAKLDGFAASLGAPERLVHDPTETAGALDRVRDRGSIASEVSALRAQADAHFDRLAAIVPAEARSRAPAPVWEASDDAGTDEVDVDLRTLVAAVAARRSPALQARIADHLRTLHDALERPAGERAAAEELARRQAEEIEWLRERADHAESELQALRGTLVYRLTTRLPRREGS